MTPDDETMRRFITCSDCGCLIETSYYATHTGCCPGKKRVHEPKLDLNQEPKRYWR